MQKRKSIVLTICLVASCAPTSARSLDKHLLYYGGIVLAGLSSISCCAGIMPNIANKSVKRDLIDNWSFYTTHAAFIAIGAGLALENKPHGPEKLQGTVQT